jgi:hypothetical protein
MRANVAHLRYPLVVLGYCLLNLLFFNMVQPYRSLGGELLVNQDFSRNLVDWRVEGDAGALTHDKGVVSINHASADSTTLAQCWPRSALPQPLLLSAEGRSERVVRGSKSWHEARIDLVGYDAQGRGEYQVGTKLLNLAGDHPWQAAQALYRLPPTAQRVCLEISLYAASGRFQVRHLSLTRGTESSPVLIGRLLLLSGWLLLALLLGLRFYRHYRGRSLGRWLLLVGLLLLAGVLMPHELRQQMEEGIITLLTGLGMQFSQADRLSDGSVWVLWPEHWNLSKLAHLLGFVLLALLLSADRALTPGRRLTALLLLAVVSETLQFFVPLRTPRLSDLTVDTLGIVISLALVGVLRIRQSLSA